jgi:hypothetical protein
MVLTRKLDPIPDVKASKANRHHQLSPLGIPSSVDSGMSSTGLYPIFVTWILTLPNHLVLTLHAPCNSVDVLQWQQLIQPSRPALQKNFSKRNGPNGTRISKPPNVSTSEAK